MDLKDLRNNIDKIDLEIIVLLSKRIDVVNKVAKYKMEKGMEIYQPDRENELLDSLKKKGAEYGLSSDFIGSLYEVILSQSRKQQDKYSNVTTNK